MPINSTLDSNTNLLQKQALFSPVLPFSARFCTLFAKNIPEGKPLRDGKTENGQIRATPVSRAALRTASATASWADLSKL